MQFVKYQMVRSYRCLEKIVSNKCFFFLLHTLDDSKHEAHQLVRCITSKGDLFIIVMRIWNQKHADYFLEFIENKTLVPSILACGEASTENCIWRLPKPVKIHAYEETNVDVRRPIMKGNLW